MPEKPRWPRAQAVPVARRLCEALKPFCARLCVAGSLRRRAPVVADVEIVYVPQLEERQVDLFNVEPVDLAAERIDALVTSSVLRKRVGAKGGTSWGERNKLAQHVDSGVPVDLFAATESTWANTLVVRTGPAALCRRICVLAQKKRCKWNTYGEGFSRSDGSVVAMTTEQEVFAFVGLPYKEPWDRYLLVRDH